MTVNDLPTVSNHDAAHDLEASPGGAAPTPERRAPREAPVGPYRRRESDRPIFVLFTTTSGDAEALKALKRMVHGLRTQSDEGAKIDATLLVQQDAAGTEAVARAIDAPPFLRVVSGGRRMSLSAARNQMLELAARERLIGADDVVAFPDDDSWYPSGLLRRIEAAFLSDPFFDLFFCRYGSAPVDAENAPRRKNPRAATVVTHASSNTLFVRGRLAAELGDFDEDLGVGTANKSGEDLDYALRAHFRGDQTAFIDAPLVGHRDKDAGVRARYYRGSLLVLARYACASGEMLRLFLRKVLIGFYFIGKKQLGFGEVASAVGAALGGIGRSAKSTAK